jgi:hypothetical protein
MGFLMMQLRKEGLLYYQVFKNKYENELWVLIADLMRFVKFVNI